MMVVALACAGLAALVRRGRDHPRRLRTPVILGSWGALIPFVGPYINFAYEPNSPLMWTTARGWLEVLPGGVAVLGGLLLLFSANRATALLGGWLAVVAGAWFVVGRAFATPLGLGEVEAPAATTQAGRMVLELAFFTGLGSMIIAIGGHRPVPH